MQIPKCDKCEAQYIPKRYGQRFCSDECKIKWFNAARKQKKQGKQGRGKA